MPLVQSHAGRCRSGDATEGTRVTGSRTAVGLLPLTRPFVLHEWCFFTILESAHIMEPVVEGMATHRRGNGLFQAPLLGDLVVGTGPETLEGLVRKNVHHPGDSVRSV